MLSDTANGILMAPIDLWCFSEDADASCAHVAEFTLFPKHTHTHTGMVAWPVSASSAAAAAEVVECQHGLIDSNILILPVTLGLRPLLSLPALPRDCNNLKTPSRMHTRVWGQACDTPISVIGSLCCSFNCNRMLINTTRRAGDPVEPSRLNSPMNHCHGKKKNPTVTVFECYTPAKHVSKPPTDWFLECAGVILHPGHSDSSKRRRHWR